MAILKRNGAARNASPVLTRNQIRGLIRKASRGNVYAFAQLATNYLDVLSEYFYLLGLFRF